MYDAVPTTPDNSPHAKLHAQRFEGITRTYSQKDVEKLRGSVRIQYTLAEMGARKLWELLHTEDYINALGALSGGQAVQMVRAGLKAIYLSGWQVAADACIGLSARWRPQPRPRAAHAARARARRRAAAARRARRCGR